MNGPIYINVAEVGYGKDICRMNSRIAVPATRAPTRTEPHHISPPSD